MWGTMLTGVVPFLMEQVMSDYKLGQLITGTMKRDAVHVAVLPAYARTRLAPGERVTYMNGTAIAAMDESIGIVDPFLNKPVERGECFLICMDPGTTTGLRHEWSHPELRDEEGEDDDVDSDSDQCRGC
jgi:hypothetical protein